MADEPGTEPPLVARLHPNRGPGVAYGVLAAFVLGIALAGVGTNVASGHLVIALVLLVAGAGIAGFLGLLCAAILGPALTIGPFGVQGRTSWRQHVDLAWDQVAITVPPDGPRRRFTLGLGVETFEVGPRSWVGFTELVLVLATTPAALERMSTEAIDELVRLLDVDGPTTTADLPET